MPEGIPEGLLDGDPVLPMPGPGMPSPMKVVCRRAPAPFLDGLIGWEKRAVGRKGRSVAAVRK
jgi:hypothetical protein